ncbi:TPA: cell wall-binding repeat-containing protein [Clostridioides difficile]|uniref:cell wall-binding repeat-containing protein n=1 Tax=Clostridioides difficile TaxID=1496 RepID=UPI0008A31E47|nr:cell wall-binding repeat-containing protein [Clostridioides difficile]OFU02820.1 cell surface protein [Clostridium sp. HMSC19D07]EGT4533342.1 cell wall-binding repeat-containing protein [Clostridioides difficile]EGT4835087.1 cell wall-binding repeat-containing protein [Clostridioides difficile]EGT4910338.1 cell wall-binding repeat-containing protein [Clostridioides difficile]EGT5503805.1 cell wall-binding repeat-containing protein [Clostridioides difficile]
MKISKKIVSLLTMTFLTVTLYGNTSNASTKDTLTGSGRWETAIKISQAGWKKSENAVLVNDNSISDALSATPFAKAKDAPILLTQSNKLDSRTKAELKRLGVKNVYLIGGSIALSSNIEKQLNAENISFERISGNSRYETSLKLAERLDKENAISKIVVVNGEKGLADAVSIGAVAAQEHMPIILSNPSDGTKISDEFIKEHNIKISYIIGGTYSISSSVERDLPNARRISGNNRNETNAKVIQEFYKNTDLKNLYVTKDGIKKQGDLIDSLAVGVLAAKNNSPIVLVGNKLDVLQRDILNTKIFDKVIQVGGMGNESVVEDFMDIQEETRYTVETVEELNSALKKSDANDTIKFKPDKKIKESFKIETDKAITIDLLGEYSESITINLPNGKINNTGNITKDIIIKDIKEDAFINNGYINYIDIYDENGFELKNEDGGEIWIITVFDNAKSIKISNYGDINKIINDSSDTIIKNSGDIDVIDGDKEPAISGNKPNINNTEKDDEKDIATGLYPNVKQCNPIKKNFVMLKVPQKPKNSSYKIYYRVVSNKPSPLEINEKIDLNGWELVEDSNPFELNAKNGQYIEVVEINTSKNKVSRWGRSTPINDGFNTM